ncbi:hypothetical protein BASA81_001838 [Batrachochytrium salamandrivorans]|nr:hypothetical protein BASA81_001838 [Batrachochytrium salamandrivorans]
MELESGTKSKAASSGSASSQYRGVSFNNHSQKWKAVITVGRKQAYDKASIDLRGPDAPTNFRYDPAAIQAFALASAQHKAATASASSSPPTATAVVAMPTTPQLQQQQPRYPPQRMEEEQEEDERMAGSSSSSSSSSLYAPPEVTYYQQQAIAHHQQQQLLFHQQQQQYNAFLLTNCNGSSSSSRLQPASLEKLDSQTNDSVESVRDVEMELNAIRATLLQRSQQVDAAAQQLQHSPPPLNTSQMRTGKQLPNEFMCL